MLEKEIAVKDSVILKGNVHHEALNEPGVKVVIVDKAKRKIGVKTSAGIKTYSMKSVKEVKKFSTNKPVDVVQTSPDYESVYDDLDSLFELYDLTPKANSFLHDSELEKFKKFFEQGREQEILSYLISYSQYIEADTALAKYVWLHESVPKMKAALIRLGYPEESIEGYFDRTEYRFDNTQLLSDVELINDFEEYLLNKYLPADYVINQYHKIKKAYKGVVQQVLTAILNDDFSNLEKELDILLENETPKTMIDLRKAEQEKEAQFTADKNAALTVNAPETPKKTGVSLKDQVNAIAGGDFTAPPASKVTVTEVKTPEVFSPWKDIKLSRGAIKLPQQKFDNSYTEKDLVGEGKFHILQIYTPKLNEKGKGGFDWTSNIGLPKPTGVDKKFLQPPKITMVQGKQSGITMKLEWYVVSLQEKPGKSKDAGCLELVTSYLKIGQVKIKEGVVDAKLPDKDWDKLLTALLSLNRLRDADTRKGIEYSLVTDYSETGEPVKFPLNTPEVFPGKVGVDFSGIRYLDYLVEPLFSVLLKDYRPKLGGTLDIGARIWILSLFTFAFQQNKEYVASELNIPYNEELDRDTPPFKFIYKGLGQKFQLPESFMEDLGLQERSKGFFDRDPEKRDLQK